MIATVRVEVGEVLRVRDGATPTVDLDLQPGEDLISFDLVEHTPWESDRVTADWQWRAVIRRYKG